MKLYHNLMAVIKFGDPVAQPIVRRKLAQTRARVSLPMPKRESALGVSQGLSALSARSLPCAHRAARKAVAEASYRCPLGATCSRSPSGARTAAGWARMPLPLPCPVAASSAAPTGVGRPLSEAGRPAGWEWTATDLIRRTSSASRRFLLEGWQHRPRSSQPGPRAAAPRRPGAHRPKARPALQCRKLDK